MEDLRGIDWAGHDTSSASSCHQNEHVSPLYIYPMEPETIVQQTNRNIASNHIAVRVGFEQPCCALIWPRLQPRHLGVHLILRVGSIERLERADDYSLDPEQSHKVNDQTYKKPEQTLTYHHNNLTLSIHQTQLPHQHIATKTSTTIKNAVLQYLRAEHGSLRLCHNNLQPICRRRYYVLCFLAWSRQRCEDVFDCRIDHKCQKLQLEGRRRSYWDSRSCRWRCIGCSRLGIPRVIAHY